MLSSEEEALMAERTRIARRVEASMGGSAGAVEVKRRAWAGEDSRRMLGSIE